MPKDLRRWLREIHRKTGQTTIFVTHDQDEALELAERVAILNKGRIEQVGSPDDIYDRPATPFVASFVGEAITLDLLIQNGRAALGTQSFKLRQHSQQEGPAQLFVQVGVRTAATASMTGIVKSLTDEREKSAPCGCSRYCECLAPSVDRGGAKRSMCSG